MQCEEFTNRVHALLDQRQPLSADGQIAHHAAECVACHDILSSYETLFEGLAQRSPLQLSEDLADRVLAEIPSRATISRQTAAPTGTPTGSMLRIASWLGPLVTAASVVFAAYLIFGNRESDQGPDSATESIVAARVESPMFEEMVGSLSEFDSKRFRMNQDQIISVGYATGRTMAQLPARMQLAASDSVSATLDALRHSASNQSSEPQQPSPEQGKTSIHQSPNKSTLAIV